MVFLKKLRLLFSIVLLSIIICNARIVLSMEELRAGEPTVSNICSLSDLCAMTVVNQKLNNFKTAVKNPMEIQSAIQNALAFYNDLAKREALRDSISFFFWGACLRDSFNCSCKRMVAIAKFNQGIRIKKMNEWTKKYYFDAMARDYSVVSRLRGICCGIDKANRMVFDRGLYRLCQEVAIAEYSKYDMQGSDIKEDDLKKVMYRYIINRADKYSQLAAIANDVKQYTSLTESYKNAQKRCQA